jgi:Cys-rich repeat protein
VGTVTLTGLKTTPTSTEIVMNPVAPGFAYQPTASVNIDYPPADEGAEIAVATSGGDYSAFQLKATGIVPLEVLGPDPVPMQSGQPMALSWTPRGSAGKSRIQVKVEISHHGGAKGAINCDVEDTGSLSVAESLVTGLITLGVAGFPTVTLSRVSTGSTDIAPGRVDLLVVQAVQRSLSIPGVVSCTTNADCPSGQTCTSTRLCSA